MPTRSPTKFNSAFKVFLGFAILTNSALRESPARAGQSFVDEEQRLQNGELKKAMMGALIFLDDTQIRQRQGLNDPAFDACSGDGCQKVRPTGQVGLPLPLPFIKNRSGEWANYIYVFPNKVVPWPFSEGALAKIQDSNMFMAAATSYPLYFFDESLLPQGQQIAKDMRLQAAEGIQSYRRGDAFSFWPTRRGVSSSAPRVGPLNIPIRIGQAEALMNFIPGLKRASGNKNFDEWNHDIFDSTLNPHGVDALANIPNDADDTALAQAASVLNNVIDLGAIPDTTPLETLLKWRDLGRHIEDGRDSWKGHDSGGILTWLKDENLSRSSRFTTPETGVIPLAVNNVDCVVNANVLFALGISGMADHPTANQVSELLFHAADRRAWPECGLYYPQRMIFPYTITRAYRDGGVRNQMMQQTMHRILYDLIKEQKEVSLRDHSHAGAFSGGVDTTYDLSTALGLVSLLNIGHDIAEDAKIASEYHQAIENAVDYLLKNQITTPIKFATTFNRHSDYPSYPSHNEFKGQNDDGRRWQSGLFFSASKWDL